MPKKIAELKEMNYKEAYNFFIKESRDGTREAVEYIYKVAKKCHPQDIRGGSVPKEIYQGGWLILIDGETCSGKTRIANEIKARYPDTVEVVDIDAICLDFIRKEMATFEDNSEEQINFLKNVFEYVDKFVSTNLEAIVAQKSAGGSKSVIVPNVYLDTLSRVVTATTLGKHFEKSTFLTVHESWETLISFFEKRKNLYPKADEGVIALQVSEAKRQYDAMEEVLAGTKYYLGFGTDLSFIVNKETDLY